MRSVMIFGPNLIVRATFIRTPLMVTRPCVWEGWRNIRAYFSDLLLESRSYWRWRMQSSSHIARCIRSAVRLRLKYCPVRVRKCCMLTIPATPVTCCLLRFRYRPCGPWMISPKRTAPPEWCPKRPGLRILSRLRKRCGSGGHAKRLRRAVFGVYASWRWRESKRAAPEKRSSIPTALAGYGRRRTNTSRSAEKTSPRNQKR